MMSAPKTTTTTTKGRHQSDDDSSTSSKYPSSASALARRQQDQTPSKRSKVDIEDDLGRLQQALGCPADEIKSDALKRIMNFGKGKNPPYSCFIEDCPLIGAKGHGLSRMLRHVDFHIKANTTGNALWRKLSEVQRADSEATKLRREAAKEAHMQAANQSSAGAAGGANGLITLPSLENVTSASLRLVMSYGRGKNPPYKCPVKDCNLSYAHGQGAQRMVNHAEMHAKNADGQVWAKMIEMHHNEYSTKRHVSSKAGQGQNLDESILENGKTWPLPDSISKLTLKSFMDFGKGKNPPYKCPVANCTYAYAKGQGLQRMLKHADTHSQSSTQHSQIWQRMLSEFTAPESNGTRDASKPTPPPPMTAPPDVGLSGLSQAAASARAAVAFAQPALPGGNSTLLVNSGGAAAAAANNGGNAKDLISNIAKDYNLNSSILVNNPTILQAFDAALKYNSQNALSDQKSNSAAPAAVRN